jgi:CspA family cold shock protein
MSDKRSHRDRHRSHFLHNEEGYVPPNPSRSEPFRTGPRTEAPPAPLEAIVKWFNPLKGFGFVAAKDGTEAFLHINQVKEAGYSDLPDGSHIKVRVRPGKKGPEVTEVVEVDTASAQPVRKTVANGTRNSKGDVREDEVVGFVKWFNASKGFGFVDVGEGQKDVFVSSRTLENSGLTDLPDGKRVRMKVVRGHKGPEARSVELLD